MSLEDEGGGVNGVLGSFGYVFFCVVEIGVLNLGFRADEGCDGGLR